MSLGASQAGYRGGLGVIDWLPGGDGELFVRIYNDTAGTLTNGDVYFLSYNKDADSLDPSARPTLDACATSAVYRQVVVVNNSPLNKATIADTEWGYVQVRGYCPKLAADSGINAIDLFIQAANGTAIAVTDGSSITNDSFAIALTAYASGFCEAMLFGERSTIG